MGLGMSCSGVEPIDAKARSARIMERWTECRFTSRKRAVAFKDNPRLITG